MMTKNSIKQNEEIKNCFAIMPISDVDSHPKGHFSHVYQDIIVPACQQAGFNACRADEVKASNLIQLDILKKLIDAPIAICDLSTRNPNVLFELGIRQAFDKPVVLIQEIGTPPIFDISGLRYLQYSKDMKYHEVLKTQKELSHVITETLGSNPRDSHINSIVKLLSLSTPAQLPDLKDDKDSLAFDVIQTEMRSLRRQMQNLTRILEPEKNNNVELITFPKNNTTFFNKQTIRRQFLRLEEEFFDMAANDSLPDDLKVNKSIEIIDRLMILQHEVDSISPHWGELSERIANLLEKARTIANLGN